MKRVEIKDYIEGLIAEKEWSKAVLELKQINDKVDDPWVEVYLRNLRIRAFEHLEKNNSTNINSACPPEFNNPFPEIHNDIPEVDVKDLNIEKLAGSIRHHGALIVRNFLEADDVVDLRRSIDQVLNHFQKNKDQERDEDSDLWYKIPRTPKHKESIKEDLKWMRGTGSMWALISPRASGKILKAFDKLDLKSLLAEYLDDEPCLSFKKWVLRRMQPLKGNADWHQDGAFMGKDIKSINLWMALTDCGPGTERPGMDFLPKRLNEILETGTHGAHFDWAISHDFVKEKFPHIKPVSPKFNSGDAIFFDHMNLHVTSYNSAYTKRRYAIETWFFASSHHPENMISVVW